MSSRTSGPESEIHLSAMADSPAETNAHADWALARAGDAVAFERLYRANVGRIHALVRRMAGSGVADDLTQEVFIRAWEKLGSFRGEAAFSTWLHRLAVNHVLTRRTTLRRRAARRVDGEEPLKRAGARRQRPDLAMDLERAVETLPEGAREVFVLYDVQGYSHAEVGEMMGISVGTSKSQLHRARMMLRERLT